MKKDKILEYLKSQKEILKKDYHIEKIVLFGSYSKNKEHFSSDIDVIIKFQDRYITPCDPWDYFNIVNSIKNNMSKYFSLNIDILDEQSDSPYLKQIKKEIIYV